LCDQFSDGRPEGFARRLKPYIMKITWPGFDPRQHVEVTISGDQAGTRATAVDADYERSHKIKHLRLMLEEKLNRSQIIVSQRVAAGIRFTFSQNA